MTQDDIRYLIILLDREIDAQGIESFPGAKAADLRNKLRVLGEPWSVPPQGQPDRPDLLNDLIPKV